MDGVPYLTQSPVMTGDNFTYTITPPDPGTFLIHPHCNESGQTGRGMSGVLIVEGDERRKPDGDIVLAYRDWRLSPDGTWLAFETPEGASRAGTFGTLRSVDGIPHSGSFGCGWRRYPVRVLNSTTRVTSRWESKVRRLPSSRSTATRWRHFRSKPGAWVRPCNSTFSCARRNRAGGSRRWNILRTRAMGMANVRRHGTLAKARPFDPAILYRANVPHFDSVIRRAACFPFLRRRLRIDRGRNGEITAR